MTSNKKRRQTELQVTRRAGQGSKRRGAQTTETVAAKRDRDKGDPEAAPQTTAGENGSAPKGAEVPPADGSAQHPAGTDREPRGSPDGGDHNDPRPAQQTESPPLQPTQIAFPKCYAALRNTQRSLWDFGNAIVAECPGTGADGVRNGSKAKMQAMQKEMSDLGFDLSLEWIRKLRKVAFAFPPDRRRPGVCFEVHADAGTPEALDEIIAKVPEGTAITRKYIREVKNQNAEADKNSQKTERRRQVEDQRKGLQSLCRQLEQKNGLLQQHYANLCVSTGKEPKPLPPPALPKEGTPRSVAEALEQSVRVLLTLHGFDPAAATLKQAIQAFVTTVVEGRQ